VPSFLIWLFSVWNHQSDIHSHMSTTAHKYYAKAAAESCFTSVCLQAFPLYTHIFHIWNRWHNYILNKMIHHNIHLAYDATKGGCHPPASCYDGLKMTIVTKPAELEHKSTLFYSASTKQP
jgi:hypothetical protein